MFVGKSNLDKIAFYNVREKNVKARARIIKSYRDRIKFKNKYNEHNTDNKFAILKLGPDQDLPGHIVANIGGRLDLQEVKPSRFGSAYVDFLTHLQSSGFVGEDESAETVAITAAQALISEMTSNIELLTDSLKSRLDKTDYLFPNV